MCITTLSTPEFLHSVPTWALHYMPLIHSCSLNLILWVGFSPGPFQVSQAWYTTGNIGWFFSNVPDLVHCRYTSSVLFECPAWCTADTPVRFFLNVPGLVTANTPVCSFECPRPVHCKTLVWFFSNVPGVSPPIRGFPGTLQMNPTGCTQGGLAWDT